jgi:hypothetical protein
VFDFFGSCPLYTDAAQADGDVGGYHWWDASDSASINSASFNRYAEWLRMMNIATGSRALLFQIPYGNSNSPNNATKGYKDNRAEYFFNYDSPSSEAVRNAHLKKFADAGVFALLFGGGEAGCATIQTDFWTDGQLFISSRVNRLLQDTNGGFRISK